MSIKDKKKQSEHPDLTWGSKKVFLRKHRILWIFKSDKDSTKTSIGEKRKWLIHVTKRLRRQLFSTFMELLWEISLLLPFLLVTCSPTISTFSPCGGEYWGELRVDGVGWAIIKPKLTSFHIESFCRNYQPSIQESLYKLQKIILINSAWWICSFLI